MYQQLTQGSSRPVTFSERGEGGGPHGAVRVGGRSGRCGEEGATGLSLQRLRVMQEATVSKGPLKGTTFALPGLQGASKLGGVEAEPGVLLWEMGDAPRLET